MTVLMDSRKGDEMKILVPVDGSEHSLGAARFLSAMALTPEDHITVFHVINFVPILHDIESYSDVIFRIKQEVAPKIVEEVSDVLRSTPAGISEVIEEGSAADLIVEKAGDEGYDVVLMGAKGVKGLRSFIVGSTTREVVSRAPLPVLAVRKAQWDIKGPLRILFADDGSEHSEAAGRFLLRFPFPEESELTVMHVHTSPVHDIPERLLPEIDEKWKDEVAKIRTAEFAHSDEVLEKAESYLREKFREIKTVAKIGDPSIEIISYAEKHGIDLVAVGCRGMKGLKGMMGSVSRNLIRHLPTSFLIARSC